MKGLILDFDGMLSVGINVSVTSLKPDITLNSTSELNFIEIKQVFDERKP